MQSTLASVVSDYNDGLSARDLVRITILRLQRIYPIGVMSPKATACVSVWTYWPRRLSTAHMQADVVAEMPDSDSGWSTSSVAGAGLLAWSWTQRGAGINLQGEHECGRPICGWHRGLGMGWDVWHFDTEAAGTVTLSQEKN